MSNYENERCCGSGCGDQANPSIECTVTQCKNHCGDQNFCTLKAIRVVTHEAHPTEIACTDCSSFILK